MMAALKDWFSALSQREKILIAIMLMLFVVILLWFALLRPLYTGVEAAKERHDLAIERHGAILAKVENLRNNTDATVSSLGAPLALFISQSAGEQGFTLGTNAARGEGQVEITIASAKPAALFSWINALEHRGILVTDMSVRSGANGTVAAAATLVKK